MGASVPLTEAEFTAVVEENWRWYVGIVSRYLKLPYDEAQDVVQNMILDILIKGCACEPTQAKGWLQACAINHGLTYRRGRKRYRDYVRLAGPIKAIRPSVH